MAAVESIPFRLNLWTSGLLCKALHNDCFPLISARRLHKSCVIKSLQAESWCRALALLNNYRETLDGGQPLQYQSMSSLFACKSVSQNKKKYDFVHKEKLSKREGVVLIKCDQNTKNSWCCSTGKYKGACCIFMNIWLLPTIIPFFYPSTPPPPHSNPTIIILAWMHNSVLIDHLSPYCAIVGCTTYAHVCSCLACVCACVFACVFARWCHILIAHTGLWKFRLLFFPDKPAQSRRYSPKSAQKAAVSSWQNKWVPAASHKCEPAQIRADTIITDQWSSP